MSMLNVDPEKRDDTFYRYKMPAIITKIEGNGNGIKTVFPNLRDICAKLNRPAEILNKFIGVELGAQATFVKQDDKFLVMGQFTQERVQGKVFDFVKRFVLCKQCRNPETDPFVQKSKLGMVCKSCGKTTDISSTERIFNVMSLHYQNEAKKNAEKKAKQAQSSNNAAVDAGEAAVDNAVAATIAAAEPIKPEQAKIQTTADDLKRDNPITTLANVLQQTPAPSVERVVHTVFELKTEHNLKDALVMRLVFRGVLEGVDKTKFVGTLQAWLGVLQHFASGKPDMALVCIKELSVATHAHQVPDKFPMALKMLWEEGVVSEADIMDWFKNYKPSGKEIPKDFFAGIKAQTTPFIEWLSAE